MTRYWVSWWSGNYAGDGCTKPPFAFWCSGSRDDRRGRKDRDEQSLCAVIDALDCRSVWELVDKHFPDAEPRFCEEKAPDWQPSPDRFPPPKTED